MSIRARLENLERAASSCPTCGTDGAGVVHLLPIRFDADGAQIIEPSVPCPTCGVAPGEMFFPISFDGSDQETR